MGGGGEGGLHCICLLRGSSVICSKKTYFATLIIPIVQLLSNDHLSSHILESLAEGEEGRG